MQSSESFQPTLPEFGMDWRFLLPVIEGRRVLVIGGEHDDFSSLFVQLGASEVTFLPAVVENPSANGEQGKHDTMSGLSARSFPPSSFDIVAVPFGFCSGKSNFNFYRVVRLLIRPGGTFLIGFSNIFFGRRRLSSIFNNSSTPWRIIRELRQVGYSRVDVYGAMPNLDAPEYILPLKPQLLGFTLQHRYRYKFSKSLLYVLSRRVTASVISNFLSYYFAVAKFDV